MATIITLPNKTGQDGEHTQAAWLLAYAIFWHFDHLPAQEETYAKSIIARHLSGNTPPQKAFIEVCERLLLAGKILQVEPATWIDLPSIWFHPEFEDGFAATHSLQRQVALKRCSIKNYQAGINVFARYYWQYLHHPSDNMLKICYRRLHKLREYSLLQTWNNVIMLYHLHK